MGDKAVLGWRVTTTLCRECASEGMRDFHPPLREGDDHGVPYHCDSCDQKLVPCEHQWSIWRPWYAGGEFRLCERDGCGEVERRPDAHDE